MGEGQAAMTNSGPTKKIKVKIKVVDHLSCEVSTDEGSFK